LSLSQQNIRKKRRNAMRSLTAFVSSIARGLCLRDASIITFAVCFAFAVSLAGCSSGGSSGGSVTESTQTITFAQPTTPVTYAPGLTVSLSATGGGSGNAVIFTVDATSTGVGTVSSNTLTVTHAGRFVVDANQAGNSNYYAADQAQRTVMVNPAMPMITTPPAAAAITEGAALSTSALTGGTASVAGSFAWTAPSTVPAVGTDSESVTFTPTDTTDYTTATTDVSIVVNPATPTITNFTIDGGQYAVEDNFSNTYLPWTVTGTGFSSGDTFSLAYQSTSTTISNFLISSFTPTTISGSMNFNALDFEPQFIAATDTNGNGTSNQYSAAFLGSASQSTLAISATTGTALQINQESGEIVSRTTSGTSGVFTGSITSQAPSNIAIDDVSGDVIVSTTSANETYVSVIDSSTRLCYFITPNVTLISSIAVKNGQIVFTAPNENLVGFASLAGCSGGTTITYTTITVAGQPWAVAMSGSDAYVLSRDDAGNGVPRVTKLSVPSGTVEGYVDLTGIPTVTSIRATTPYEGIWQITAFNTIADANVLFMSDKTDGVVLSISTNTTAPAKMAITYSTQIIDLPVAIAPQEIGSVTKPVLWIGYIPADTGGNVMDVGAFDPSTGDYTSAVGSCQAGLVGGFAASANGLQCAQGDTIGSPLVLSYSTY
jgi:hypothetical protein